MAKAARGLGKGLDSLIPASVPKAEPVQETAAKEDNAQGTYVKITKVEPNREQPRKILMRMLCRSLLIPLSSMELWSL